jgi:hypothetical protein
MQLTEKHRIEQNNIGIKQETDRSKPKAIQYRDIKLKYKKSTRKFKLTQPNQVRPIRNCIQILSSA